MLGGLGHTYREVIKLLSSDFRRKFIWVQLLIITTSFVDLLGLAIFIPVISAVGNEEIIDQSEYANWLKSFLGVSDNREILLFLFVVALLFFVLRSLFILFSQWIQSRFVFSLGEYISIRTYRHYLCMNYEEFRRFDSTKIVRELTVSPGHFAKFLVKPLLLLSSEFVVLVLVVGGIFIYNSSVFLLIMCTVFPIAYLFNRMVKNKIRAFGEQQNSLTPVLLENSMRGIFGFIDVKLRKKGKVLVDDYKATVQQLNAISIKTSVISIIPAKLFEVTTILGLFVIFIYGMFISSNSESILPLIAMYAAAAYRLIPSLSRVLPALLSIEQFLYLFDIYSDALSSDASLDTGKSEPISFDDNVRLDNVSFAYKGANQILFKNLSLDIKKGEIVGLIGKSGSGKTSLVNLIAGFLIPTSGELYIDNVKINSENLDRWRNLLSYVQQSPYLERGTLASNVAFLDKEVDQNRMHDAINKAALSDLIEARAPEDFLIDEHGKNLSGGQKQRVVIARALYHKAQLIILDEATAALDAETEEEINATVKSLRSHGVTIIIIAHRLSTLKYTDRIIRLESGKIAEETIYSRIQMS